MPKKAPPRYIAARLPLPLVSGLDEVERLIDRKKFLEARDKLDQLDRRYPSHPDLLRMLANVSNELRDAPGYQTACERLLALEPDDAEVALALAGAYLINAHPSLALRAFRRFLERFPDDPGADEARDNIARLEPHLAELLDGIGLKMPDDLEFAQLHEEVQSALSQGDYPQARKLAERLLKQRPEFAPALNNMSQAFMLEGRLDQAIATAQRVLAFAPGNIHTLANLVIFNCRLGRLDEARTGAEQLKQSEEPGADKWLKIAEALSYLGDDAGVLDAFASAEKIENGPDAMTCHFAAVAHLRQGNEVAARRHWQRALKLSPGLELALENIEDLRKPIGERNAPWPFTLNYWITGPVLGELRQQVVTKKTEQAIASSMNRIMQRHPEIPALVPILLDRGDPQGRQFALMVAQMLETPELLAALRDFALGQRGSDALRHRALIAAEEAGMFEDRKVRMWRGGKWQDLVLMGFQISYEPEGKLDKQIEPLMIRANEALQAGNAAQAERLLNQALALAPDTPALLNNLAAAYSIQERNADAEALIRQIHERHPDYLFARTSLARMHTRAGRLDAAEELLRPLLAHRRLHVTEARALFTAQIELLHTQGNTYAARSWLKMWADFDPDSPDLARARRLLDSDKTASIKRRPGRPRKK